MKHLEITCKKCGFVLVTENEEDIKDFQELYDTGHFQCPMCGSRKFTFRMKGVIP